MQARVAAFVSRRYDVPENTIQVDVHPLRGGLESAVARVRIRRHKHRGVPSSLVVKELPTGFAREADVYETLWHSLKQPPAVRMLGRELTPHFTYLYLEEARPLWRWPWSDTALAAAVCRALARFHDSPGLPRQCFAWDYESELTRSAEATLDTARSARDAAGRRYWRRQRALRRVIAELPAIRARLLSRGTTVIHGDMHPGNVIIRRSRPGVEVVLIDWGRARIGSPLEDIASWLHSLGCWEPRARQRHDTLMRAYLDARTAPRPFGSSMRLEYWLASASNALSGAIRYHLTVLGDSSSSECARDHSARALQQWERVVRRAAALVSTSLDR